MKEKIKQRWIEALRSGKYQKGYRRLRSQEEDREPTYCVLGVLAEISELFYEPGDDVLPPWIRQWSGVPKCVPIRFDALAQRNRETYKYNLKLGSDPQVIQLHQVNDFSGASFDEMADLIDEYL